MSKRLLCLLGGVILSFATAGLAFGQDQTTTTTTTSPTTNTQVTSVQTNNGATVTKMTQNADGTWTVVQYPAGQEVAVDLTPTVTTTTIVPRAKVLHSANGTTITIDPTTLAGIQGNYNLYAVDPMGHVTMLGPIAASSTSPLTFNTPLDKFMLVVSPEANLTTIAPNSNIAFRSAVPKGFDIIPLARSGEGPGAPVGEKVAAVGASNYNGVAMLNVPSLPMKKETELRVQFPDATRVNRTTIFVTPNFNNKAKTRVKAKFHELTDVPQDAFLTLWAIGPNGQFWRIGSTPNKGNPNVATIDSDSNNTNVPFSDFGLFLTVEPTGTATAPTGTIYGTIIR